MLTVYYDGKCGLCSKEIRYYQRIAPESTFIWTDITQTPDGFITKGYRVLDGLKVLHVEDAYNEMHVGVDAFIQIWRNLPYWSVLANFVSLPVVKPLAKLIYRKFAEWRFARLDHCQISLKSENI